MHTVKVSARGTCSMPAVVVVRSRKLVCPLKRRLANYEDQTEALRMPALFIANKRNYTPLFGIGLGKFQAKDTGAAQNNFFQWHPAKLRQPKEHYKITAPYELDPTPGYNKVGKSLPAITMTLPRIQVPEKMKCQLQSRVRKWYYRSGMQQDLHTANSMSFQNRQQFCPERVTLNMPVIDKHTYIQKDSV